MRAACIVAASLGWGVVAGLANHPFPGITFLVGLGLGAGVMLLEKEKE